MSRRMLCSVIVVLTTFILIMVRIFQCLRVTKACLGPTAVICYLTRTKPSLSRGKRKAQIILTQFFLSTLNNRYSHYFPKVYPKQFGASSLYHLQNTTHSFFVFREPFVTFRMNEGMNAQITGRNYLFSFTTRPQIKVSAHSAP